MCAIVCWPRFFQKFSSATPLLNILDPRLDICNQTKSKIETFSKHYFETERGQKVAKKPNFFFEAKQEKKKPKSSYLASNRPKYQPCLSLTVRVLYVKQVIVDRYG